MRCHGTSIINLLYTVPCALPFALYRYLIRRSTVTVAEFNDAQFGTSFAINNSAPGSIICRIIGTRNYQFAQYCSLVIANGMVPVHLPVPWPIKPWR